MDTAYSQAELALCRSILYQALVLGFCPPEEEIVVKLGSVEGCEALAEAAAAIDPELAECARALAGAGELRSLTARFRAIFGHTSRGAVPPYETEYGTDALFLQPQEMADIGGFLQAFGLAVDPRKHQRVDHLACECEFLGFLCRKEAYALGWGDEEMLTLTRRAQRLFLKDHLGRFGPAVGRKLAREDQGGFYGALGRLCAAFLESECRRFELPVGPAYLELRPELPEVPMACGAPLLQIEGE